MLSDLALRIQMDSSADLADRLVRKSAGRFELRPQPHRLWLAGPECHRLCRFRRVVAIALRSAFESDETMLRAYIATR